MKVTHLIPLASSSHHLLHLPPFFCDFLLLFPYDHCSLISVAHKCAQGGSRGEAQAHMLLWDAPAVLQQADGCAVPLAQEQAFLGLVRSISGQNPNFLWFSPTSELSCGAGCGCLGHCSAWTMHGPQGWYIWKHLLQVYITFVLFFLLG